MSKESAYREIADQRPEWFDDDSVGDIKSEARGSGARLNSGKSEYHQLPLFALEGVVKVLMYGAKKYAPGNWAKGQPWTVTFDSLMRHLVKWQRGEELDAESELPHLDHALCNLIFLSAYRDLYPEGDNRLAQFKEGGVKDDARRPSESKDQVRTEDLSACGVLPHARAERHGQPVSGFQRSGCGTEV